MSEYQYYEFRAIDRPLIAAQMEELRSFSGRAQITPTSFVNEYSYGSFKGDADAWMQEYFDAHLYVANWGTHLLMLALPACLLDQDAAAPYFVGDCVSVVEANGKVILSFLSEAEDGGGWEDGEGQLEAVIGVRAELERGDLRALYIGWLLCAQNGDLDDDALEPPVPPGLGNLSESQENLVEFLRVDEDLLHVAAQASSEAVESTLAVAEVATWLHYVAVQAKDDALAKLIVDDDFGPVRALRQRLVKERRPAVNMDAGRRTVRDLLDAAEAWAEEREINEARARAEKQEREARAAAAAREAHLHSLEGRERELWMEVEQLVSTKQAKSYDQAVQIVRDLRDLDIRNGGGAFAMKLSAFQSTHASKKALIERLRKARL